MEKQQTPVDVKKTKIPELLLGILIGIPLAIPVGMFVRSNFIMFPYENAFEAEWVCGLQMMKHTNTRCVDAPGQAQIQQIDISNNKIVRVYNYRWKKSSN